ncbi:hypothetical protein R3X27_01840 [Tropicimonas sp. TH_r6]|uniref:hypothetical protein n=1 Tax=Tropicimonas sp. TH_r6 TaxID=3082085 RepID=UPI002953E8C3|nr:hypothetical protein [Tropicimonas sp. TH_r6]MDV7141416.1 hypothetical protein [Tropicimonas sp. TH_r6]
MDRSVYIGAAQERNFGQSGQTGDTGRQVAAGRGRLYRSMRPMGSDEVATAAIALRKTVRNRQDALELRATLARKFDIRAITPKEIDALADALSTEGPDATARRNLLSYGAEFRRNLANVAWQAGLTARPGNTLEAHLDTALDLIAAIEDVSRHPIFTDRPIVAAKEFSTWLQSFADLRSDQITTSACP